MKRLLCALCLTMIIALSGCSASVNWNIGQDEFYSQKENEYYVYIYSRYCPACEYLKEDVLAYQDSAIKENKTYIYSLDSETCNKCSFVDDEQLVVSQKGNQSITTTLFYQTPSLYLIKDWSLAKVIISFNEISNILKGD